MPVLHAFFLLASWVCGIAREEGMGLLDGVTLLSIIVMEHLIGPFI